MLDNQAEIDAQIQDEERGFRRYQGPLAIFAKILGAAGCLFFLLYQGGAFAYFNIFLLPIAYNAIFLAVVLTLTFLLVPARKASPKDKLPWYDMLLIVGSLAGCIYIFANALELSYFGKISATPLEMALAYITILSIAEAVRRSFGWAMLIIVATFLLYTKFGYLLTGPLRVYYFSWENLATDTYLSTLSIFGGITRVASTIIIAYVTFGVFFVAAGGGKFFINLALSIAGRMRGGAAKAAIVGSALFGTISGSGSANVVVTGTVTIPLMKANGYKPYYAAAVEAIASTGGQIMPPVMGSLAFVMAELLAMPYAKIAALAALPAILYFTSLFTQVDLQAAKQGQRGLPKEYIPSAKATLKAGWEYLIPFLVLFFVLFVLRYPAVNAAIYGIVSIVIVSWFRRQNRIDFKRFIDSLEGGMRGTLAVATMIALASVILSIITVTGLGPKLSSALVTIFGGNTLTLILAAGISCFILGMGVSMTASYVLVSVLVAPALSKLGLPLVVSHFFILYLVTSTLFTPPYCPTAYVAAGLARASAFRTAFQAMRLGIVCYIVPFIIIFNPALILIGSLGEIVLAAATAIIGIFTLSVGIEGFLFSRVNLIQRLLFIAGGIIMVVPGLQTDIVGAVIIVIAVLWQRLGSRQLKTAPQ
ncbi:TRAP transporter permease [Chloroflexota bacterium]